MKKVALIVGLFFGTMTILSTQGVKTVSEAQAAVSQEQVIDYLGEYGYEVVSANPKPNTIADWICETYQGSHHYWTTVHVSGTTITGFDNVIIL